MLFAKGGRAFVSADKTSVVSRGIPQALWTQGRPLRRRPCVENDGGDVFGDHRWLVCRHKSFASFCKQQVRAPENSSPTNQPAGYEI